MALRQAGNASASYHQCTLQRARRYREIPPLPRLVRHRTYVDIGRPCPYRRHPRLATAIDPLIYKADLSTTEAQRQNTNTAMESHYQ